MLRDREGRKLWIQTERGEFDPLESYQQIDERRKSQDGPDWWVVAKEPDWAPPKRRMSLVAGGLGGHTKPNSHGDQQPYDELGRYAGPGEGAWSEKPQEETARGGSLLTTLLGRDGDDFLAGHSGGDVLDKRRAYRPANQGLDHRQPMASTQREPLPELPDWPSGLELPDWPNEGNVFPGGAGVLTGGNQTRQEPGTDGEQDEDVRKLPPPIKGKPCILWIQDQGTLMEEDGRVLAEGHAGQGQCKNNPDCEGVPDQGPVPAGNWRMVLLNDKEARERHLATPVFRLVPADEETRRRAEALHRKPFSFLIHGARRDGRESSQGCIILDWATRDSLRKRKDSILRILPRR
ncbi:MAG: tlde1 domain-containing protein [Desulfovibrio aminophilus]|jgi:hypothetical protein|uniref:tlde1 domain-containing protein n=1 Tax=Desulfovibrio aminophilus TaxID=81425 RepID=UPI0039ECD113